MSSICYRCLRNSVVENRCRNCGAPAVFRAPDDSNMLLPLGTYLQNGRFIVGDKLGGGGFGITYIARDLKFDKLIALKEFVPRHMLAGRRGLCLQFISDRQEAYKKSLKSFFREAYLLNEMHHPNIVKVYYAFEENNTAYYVMDLLQGEDLKTWTKGRLPLHPVEACSLLLPVMNALVYIHREKKTLHRDISPDNIFIRKDPRYPTGISPCLIDFGAAFTAMQDYTHTMPGVKKSGFSPLEQNWDKSKQGPFTDVYAFAATFYYLITGKVPIPSNERELQNDKLAAPSRFNKNITPAVDQVIKKGLALLPKDRYQDMIQFRQDICAATGVPIPSPTPQPIPVPPPPPDPIPVPPPDPIPPTPWPKPEPYPPQPEPAEEKRSPKYLAALMLDGLAFLGIPAAVMAIISPLVGLGIGCGLMLTINTLLCCLPKQGTLFQHILGCLIDVDGDSGVAARLLIYNLLRVLLPFSIVDEVLALSGAISSSIIEDIAGVKPLSSGRKAKQDGKSEFTKPDFQPDPVPVRSVPQKPAPEATLNCIDGLCKGRRFKLGQRETLGRNKSFATLTFPNEDSAISGRHCEIYFEHGKWLVQDVGSRNGTLINGERIAQNKPVKLSNGDRIRIGGEQFTFHTK